MIATNEGCKDKHTLCNQSTLVSTPPAYTNTTQEHMQLQLHPHSCSMHKATKHIFLQLGPKSQNMRKHRVTVLPCPPLANSRVSARRSPWWGGETVAK